MAGEVLFMSLEGTWPVYEDGRQVGTCTVARQGLYLRFDCRCGPADGRILRLVLRSPAGDVSLGIPAPEEGILQLRKGIPAKRMPQVSPGAFGLPPQAGPRPRAGTRSHAGADSGTGACPHAGADSGAGARAHAGADSGTGACPHAGADSGTGACPHAGANSGTGARAHAGADSGTGARPHAGADFGTGVRPHSGANPGTRGCTHARASPRACTSGNGGCHSAGGIRL